MAFDDAVARGSDALKAGDLDIAIAQFKAALGMDPDNTRVLALLGLSYFRANNFDQARPIYEALVERAATDASHRLNLGLLYLKLNDADKAINSLEASRALDPSQGRAINYLGLAYARAGRYAEAYRSFLLAGQNELALEIEINLTPAERDGIQSQLGRSPAAPPAGAAAHVMGPAPQAPSEPAIPRTITPTSVAAAAAAPAISRTISEPRTKPPSAPPKPRTISTDLHAPDDEVHDQGLSHPEIVIERESGPISKMAMAPVRSGASNVEPTSVFKPIAPSRDGELRMTESQLFVLPLSEQAAPAAPQQSMVSAAVAMATPAATQPDRTRAGGFPPRPLSELATVELLRPEDGSDPLEVAESGALIIRITDRVITRLDGVHITGGDLQYEIAKRRSRGHQTDEKLDYGGTLLHSVSGHGYLVAIPRKRTVFSAVKLDDDILYMREDMVFAFESTLRWESGNVPGLRGKLPVLQFRGDGALAIQISRPLVRVKLPASGVVFIDADRLAGWIGRVIPRAVQPPPGGPMGTTCVEFTGEGIVLVEPLPDPEPRAAVAVPMANIETAPYGSPRTTPPTPPPAPPAEPAPSAFEAQLMAEIDPEMDMSGVMGDDEPAPTAKSDAASGGSTDEI
ncbi:MAG TPA: tetratricopeptide repeat protein [Kofleriaceae bacterium]